MNQIREGSVGTSTIPDDLVIEILSRLPRKSLSGFRCVSNLWRDLISDVFTRRRRNMLPFSGFFFDGVFVPIDPELQHLHEEFQSRLKRQPFFSSIFEVEDSCNGLLLFSHFPEYPIQCSLFVCNPTTMEFVALPDRQIAAYSSSKCFPAFAYSSSKCFLAYNPLDSPHYKVVLFTLLLDNLCFDGTIRMTIDIYSSMMGRWASRAAPPDPTKFFTNKKSSYVFHKGALYIIYDHERLVRFDIEKGSFSFIMLPANGNVLLFTFIGESRGNLYYAVKTLFAEYNGLYIYMLDEQNTNKWLLVHKMSDNKIINLDFRPIAFHPESELMYLSLQSKILSYHPSSGQLEEVCRLTDYGLTMNWYSVFPVIPCFESLDPPGGKFIN